MNKKYQFNTNEKFIIILFIGLSLEYAIEYYSGQGVVSALIAYRCIAALYAFVCLYFMFKYRYRTHSYAFAGFSVFLYDLLISFVMLFINGIEKDFITGLICFGIILGITLNKVRFEVIESLISVISKIGIVVFLWIILTQNIDLSVALRRGYVWTNFYYYDSVFWAVIPAVLLSFLFQKKKAIPFVYWGCAVLLNILFQKRYILADSIILFAMLIFIMVKIFRKSAKSVVKMGVLFLVISLIVYLFSRIDFWNQIFGGLLSRFENIDDLSSFDRFAESINYFSGERFVYIITGRGFWGAHDALDTLNPALHVGWLNFIFKGGIPLFLLALIPVIRAFCMLPKIKIFDKKTQFAITFLCICSIRLFYTNMYSFTPELVLFFWACTTVMEKRNEALERGIVVENTLR